ncbi:MAG: S8 family serine peptidase [Candidatus Aenigmarchaeota archaeon]|nr:S8 family serine peptidase [Candidatus Aenigmarchaeota archaeon]
MYKKGDAVKKLSSAFLSFVLLFILTVHFATAGTITSDLEREIRSKGPLEKIAVIIQFHEKPAQADINDLKANNARIKYVYEIINGAAVELPILAVQNIARRRYVKLIEPDYVAETVLDKSISLINANDVWVKNTTGAGVRVAILDTGITTRSEVNVAASADFTGEGAGDFNGHGTHVAATASNTHLTYTGVAPTVQLVAVKVLNASGSGFVSNIIAGIDWATTNADILSLSLGAVISQCDGTDSLSLAVDNAVSAGKIVTVAAGNLGPIAGTITSPGCSKKAITVGASDDADNIASFSSRGPTADGRTKPDVVAPGVGIISLNNSLTGTRLMSGTSMSTPHVAGVAALLKSKNSALTQTLFIEVLKNSSKNIGLDANTQGFGRVDALAAYNVLNPEVCGNTVCAGGETCSSCPTDCGSCPALEVCGNRVCGSGESCKNCRIDCGKCPSRRKGTALVTLETEQHTDYDVMLTGIAILAISIFVFAATSRT